MICYSCGHSSLHARCPFCGAKDIRQVVGFDPLDLFNPFQLGKDVAQGGGVPSPAQSAYDAGQATGRAVQKGPSILADTLSGPLDVVTSSLSMIRWVIVGGVVVGAVVVLYGVIKFLPVLLGVAAKQAEGGVKAITQVASKAL